MPPRSGRSSSRKPEIEKPAPKTDETSGDQPWKKIGTVVFTLLTVVASIATVLQWLEVKPVSRPPSVSSTAPIPAVNPSFTPSVTPFPLTNDQEAIRLVIEKEVDAAVRGDFATLESLYAPNPVVIDRSGTPLDDSDNRRLEGWEEIRQQHYVGLIVIVRPKSMILKNPAISVNGDTAYFTHEGVIRDNVYYRDFSLYKLQKINGTWLIVQLEFNNVSDHPVAQETSVYMLTQAPLTAPSDFYMLTQIPAAEPTNLYLATQDTGSPNSTNECLDGIDNDGDGYTDFPQDPECRDKQGNSESNP